MGSDANMSPAGQGNAGAALTLAPGRAQVNLIDDAIYLSGQLTPHCHVVSIQWAAGTSP